MQHDAESTHFYNFIMLRGLGRESAHWGSFPEQLRKRFAPCNVQTLDVPGTGIYHQKLACTKITENIEYLNKLFSHPEGAKNIVIAVSMGGMIAMEWVRRYPDLFQHVFLINSSAAGLSPFYQRMKPKAIATLLRAVLTKNIQLREKSILNLVANYPHMREKVLPTWVKAAKERPMLLQNFFRQIFAAGQYRFKEIKSSSRFSIVASTNDRLCDYKCSLALNSALHAKLHTHTDAGHDIAIDAPDWLLDVIARDLKS